MKTVKSAGFSLIEVMIVVAIIAIIAAYAYPSYQDQVSKSQRTEGQAFLLDAMAKQERYYSENNSYTNDLANLGYSKNGSNFETENAYYFVVASACDDGSALTVCVKLSGTAQGPLADNSGANNLTLNSRNVKTGKW